MKKARGWLKRLALGIVLVPVVGIGIVFAQIPKQEKLVCEFDDGDQIIIRQDYTFQLMGYIAKPVPVKNYAGKSAVLSGVQMATELPETMEFLKNCVTTEAV